MEAFQLLSRGGAFDKQKFKSDVHLFNVCVAFLDFRPFPRSPFLISLRNLNLMDE